MKCKECGNENPKFIEQREVIDHTESHKPGTKPKTKMVDECMVCNSMIEEMK